jgi:hypothetical protein
MRPLWCDLQDESMNSKRINLLTSLSLQMLPFIVWGKAGEK